MSQKRLELKVGLFVFFALALAAALLIRFSKSTTFFRPTYDLVLKSVNVGGLKPKASVLMSGVQVGTVSSIQLGEEGTNVTIIVKIYGQHIIRDDARFIIEQSGFLGDQFVAVYPDKNAGKKLQPGATARVQAPFNLQEVARAAAGFITRIDATASNVNAAVNDLRREVLNQETMSNLAASIANIQKVSDNAVGALDKLNALIATNSAPINSSVSNLLEFSDRLNILAQSARDIVATNQPQISATVSNLQQSSMMLTNFLADIKSENGVLGMLIHDETVAHNIASLAENLDVFTASLRSNSFWHVLFHKPAPSETAAPKYPDAEPQKQK